MFNIVSIIGNYVHLGNVYFGGRESYQLIPDSKGNIELSDMG